MRWFVWLILLRPLIDNFYYLKEVSPFVSPLYIVGALTPVLIFYSLLKNKRKPPQTLLDINFKVWGSFVIIGIVIMAFSGVFTLPFWIISIKLSAPIYLFIFLRHFIRNRKDLHGVLQTFLYSAIVIVCVFLYESIIHPLNLVHTRGIERWQGNFADVFNYATYVSFCTLINYYFLLQQDSSLSHKARIRNVIINLLVSTAMLVKMSHVATDIIFIALNVLYLLIAFKRSAANGLIVMSIIGLIIYAYGNKTIEKNLLPLVQTDINVYSGDKDDSYYLHGRVGRWQRITDIFNKTSIIPQLFGMAFTGGTPYAFMTGGVHNDYLRNLICTGYVGLFIYLLYLYNLFRRIIKEREGILYLGLGALGVLILYSISVTPTVYASFLYIILSVFAYFSIPLKVLHTGQNTHRLRARPPVKISLT